MRKILIIIAGSVILFSLYQCKTNMDSSKNNVSYTPLAVGDITQMIMMKDSSTILFSIVGKATRADGKKVFLGLWKSGTQEPDTSYYLVSDGYFKATELDTVKDDSLLAIPNPFREQRLAKSFPEEGDTFIHTIGEGDSSYWYAEKVDTLTTLFGKVNNVFRFQLYTGSRSLYLLTCYAKGIGWIATDICSIGSPEIDYLCAYKKIYGKTYGRLWPEKDSKGLTKFVKEKVISSLIGSSLHKSGYGL